MSDEDAAWARVIAAVREAQALGRGGDRREPRPPLASRDLPPEKRREFWEVRHALFDLGRLTGDEADLWAWRIMMDREP